MRKTGFAAIVVCVLAIVVSSCGRSEKEASSPSSMFDRDDAVKNAYVSIVDNRVASVRDAIYESLTRYDAEAESESWDDAGKANESVSLTVRVPSAGFMEYVNYLKASFAVDSLRMYARRTTEKSAKNGEIDANGVVYSTVRISVERKIGFVDSFMIGMESGSDALKASLRSIVPVVLFLLPYATIAGLIAFAVKVIRKYLPKKK